ncbi:MAG: TonB-dependent receptor [Acidimicrobiia bacterium]|nr:TonB-dependent receptor [Acidimicrobiia bacterium]
MGRSLVFRVVALLVLLVGIASTPALAQSSIAGQVTDNTGAVLPGVTVEVGGPSLIEGSRVVTTDGEGRYTVVDLRPGAYRVTFSLEGFNRVIREGIQLPSNFTATVDTSMSVGALSESITVSGSSPIVDVQQAQRSQVLDSALLESLVNSQSLWVQANFVSGVRISGTDVGGSQYSRDLQLETHGASSLHNSYMMDGLSVDNASQDGADNINYYTTVSNQETVIETSGGTAEAGTGGVRLNMIPKDGSNRYAGTGYVGGSRDGWQSNNFRQRLRDRGVTAVSAVDGIWDYSATAGGPIVANKLWFHFSARKWGNELPVADSYYDDGRQYALWGEMIGLVPRITWQATRRNKFTVHVERLGKYTGPRLACCASYPAVLLPQQRGADPETATTWKNGERPYGAHYVKWSSPISSRVLVEAGRSTSFILDGYPNQEGVESPRFSPAWYANARKVDLDLGIQWNSANWSMREVINHENSASVSFVTGTHNMRFGFQHKDAKEELDNNAIGDIQQIQYRSGVPDSVSVGNYPVLRDPRLDYDMGLFAQDRWAIGRLTATAGLRVQWLKSSARAVSVEGGRFVGARSFDRVDNVPKWGPDLSPRLGLAYDLFGDAKTALKFSVGKYFTRVMTTYAKELIPLALVTQSLPWNDRDLTGRSLPSNLDGIAQDNELDFTRLPTNFGTRNLARLDPNFKREYNVETALSIQHELFNNVSLSGGWFHRSFHNMFLCTVAPGATACAYPNTSRSPSDYDPVQVVSPYDGEVFTAYNLKSAALLSRVDNLITNSPTNRQVYDGFEVALQARLRNGGTLLANSTTQRTLTDRCDVRDDPNLLRFCDRFDLPGGYRIPFRADFKLAFSYPVYYGIMASLAFTSSPGRQEGNIVAVDEQLPIFWNLTRTTRYTAENCAGRPCTPGALVIPNMVQTSIVLPLVPTGSTRFLERLNQLDLSLRRTFRARKIEWTPEFDIYNALNADTVTAERSANFGTAAYGVPQAVLLGRLMRLAIRVKW